MNCSTFAPPGHIWKPSFSVPGWQMRKAHTEHHKWDREEQGACGAAGMACTVLSTAFTALSALCLLLVMALCRSKEILQNALHVLKGGTVLWFGSPASHHDIVELLRTAFRTGHAVAVLQSSDHLRARHPYRSGAEHFRGCH